MTRQTWLFGFVATLLILGLAACGGDGGDGGGGGGIPTATNAAITPPPTTPLAITTGGGAMPTNQSIAANAFQAGGGALSDATDLLGSVQGGNSGTQARREPVGAAKCEGISLSSRRRRSRGSSRCRARARSSAVICASEVRATSEGASHSAAVAAR